ncbi:hypothetical protein SLA2020_065590 [Shorea laevis]
MKIVTWNNRGVRHASFRRECKELLKLQQPDIICFLETKAEEGSPNLQFMLRFGFDKQHRVHSLGRAVGYGYFGNPLYLIWRCLSQLLKPFTVPFKNRGCPLAPHLPMFSHIVP